MGNIRKKITNRNGKEYVSWEARYTVGFDPGTGKQIQRSISGKSQKEVAKKLKEVLANLENREYVAPCKLTVGEWLDAWLEEYLHDVKVTTKQTYTIEVNTHLKANLGHATAAFTLDVYAHVTVKMRQDSAARMQQFYDQLQNDGA